jgi:two-component system NtrC family response regulator
VPPLRDRQGDAIVLARAFLQRYAAELKRPVRGFSEAAIAVVEQYRWPGNVRELENRVKRAVIMADGALVTPEDLELVDVKTTAETFDLREVREAAETRAILRALGYADQNMSRAAELLGVTRPTLYSLLRKYDIPI